MLRHRRTLPRHGLGYGGGDKAPPSKKRLRVEDLLDCFEEIRRREQLDESTAAMLAEQYV